MLDNVGNESEWQSSTTRSQRSQGLSEDDGVVLEEEDYEQDHEVPERELEFEWTGMMEEALCGEPSPSHRAALDLLKDCYNASNGRLRAQREEVHELRVVIERRGMSNDDHLQKMGELHKLIQKHGTVARAARQWYCHGISPPPRADKRVVAGRRADGGRHHNYEDHAPQTPNACPGHPCESLDHPLGSREGIGESAQC